MIIHGLVVLYLCLTCLDQSVFCSSPTTHHPQNLEPTSLLTTLLFAGPPSQKNADPPTSDFSIHLSVSQYPMSSTTLFRLATRTTSCRFFKASYTARPRVPVFVVASGPAIVALGGASSFSTTSKWSSAGHEEETFEEFSAR